MKELIHSVTKKDFDVQFTKGSGAGGQKRNKTSSACRIIHRESGAVGYAEDTRSQLQNKRLAFERLIETGQFKAWHKQAIGRKAVSKTLIEEQLKPSNLRVEIKNSDGVWVEWDE